MLTIRNLTLKYGNNVVLDNLDATFERNGIIDSYSTGMKKKLAFLSILILNKEIVILDEPFNGMDIESIYIFQRILLKLKSQHKIILISSHILNTLEQVCDKIYFLNNKKFEAGYDKPDYLCLQDKIQNLLTDKLDLSKLNNSI
jgi:ABC-2 type transport system ATP-binding protein